MTYQEACDLIEKNKHLIGTKDSKGFTIGKFLILPSDESKQRTFLEQYILQRNEDTLILSYIYDDLEVWAIDIEYLNLYGVLFYEKYI